MKVKENTLIQTVHPDVEKLRVRSNETTMDITNDNTVLDLIQPDRSEINISIVENEADVLSIVFSNQVEEAVKITYDKNTGVFELDRSQSGELPNNQDNQKRSVKLFDALKSLRIFIDTSSIEIFINEGTHVMTSRLFPVEPYQYCQLSSESGTVKMETKQYELKRG